MTSDETTVPEMARWGSAEMRDPKTQGLFGMAQRSIFRGRVSGAFAAVSP